jgi:hypothetical protein
LSKKSRRISMLRRFKRTFNAEIKAGMVLLFFCPLAS